MWDVSWGWQDVKNAILTHKSWLLSAYDPHYPDNTCPIELIHGHQRFTPILWCESQAVLKSLHNALILKHCRTWMAWDAEMCNILLKTQPYTNSPLADDAALEDRWRTLVNGCLETWDKIVKFGSVQGQPLDYDEEAEQQLLLGDGEGNVVDEEGLEELVVDDMI